MNNNTIFCPKCGTSNVANTRFCSRCGNQLQGQPSISQQMIAPVNVQNNQASQQSNETQQVNTVRSSGSMNYFKYMFNVILKPYTEFKNQENNLSSFKHSAILTLILVGALTIINLITTMLNIVRVESFWSDEVEWIWENLKEIEYFKVIGQDLLAYTLIIVAIAGIYFLAALVMKKDVKFPKLLGISATAFLPMMISVAILSPLLSMIYSPLGLIISAIGFIYGVILLIELVNDVVVLHNKNIKIYYHLTCLSIFITILIIVFYVVLGSALSLLG